MENNEQKSYKECDIDELEKMRQDVYTRSLILSLKEMERIFNKCCEDYEVGNPLKSKAQNYTDVLKQVIQEKESALQPQAKDRAAIRLGDSPLSTRAANCLKNFICGGYPELRLTPERFGLRSLSYEDVLDFDLRGLHLVGRNQLKRVPELGKKTLREIERVVGDLPYYPKKNVAWQKHSQTIKVG